MLEFLCLHSLNLENTLGSLEYMRSFLTSLINSKNWSLSRLIVLCAILFSSVVSFWNIENGNHVTTFNGGDGVVTSLMSVNFKNQNVLFSAGEEKMIRVWCMKNGKLVKIISGIETRISCLDYISKNFFML